LYFLCSELSDYDTLLLKLLLCEVLSMSRNSCAEAQNDHQVPLNAALIIPDTSNNLNTCEDVGTQLMEACEGRLVENHPYLNVKVLPNPDPEPYSFKDYDADLDVFIRNTYECKTFQGANHLYNKYFLEAFDKLKGDELRNNAARHTTKRLKNHAHLTGLHRGLLNHVEAYCDDIKIAENPWLSNDILQICAALSGVVMGGLILGGMIVFPASLLIGALLTTVSTLAIGYKLFDSCNDGEGYRPAAGFTFF
jgi:hypothetical protein